MDRMNKNRNHDKKRVVSPKPTFTAKNAERERSRVKSLRNAFQSLQLCLPSVPPNTKLSKLDILILATNYISYLTRLLSGEEENQMNPSSNIDGNSKFLHPIKKWPMRSRLYSGAESVDTQPMSTMVANIGTHFGLEQELCCNNYNLTF